MKCLCGYEFLYDFQTDDDIQIGDEEFIRIGGIFRSNEGSWDEEKYELNVCPKCGTVRANKTW